MFPGEHFLTWLNLAPSRGHEASPQTRQGRMPSKVAPQSESRDQGFCYQSVESEAAERLAASKPHAVAEDSSLGRPRGSCSRLLMYDVYASWLENCKGTLCPTRLLAWQRAPHAPTMPPTQTRHASNIRSGRKSIFAHCLTSTHTGVGSVVPCFTMTVRVTVSQTRLLRPRLPNCPLSSVPLFLLHSIRAEED